VATRVVCISRTAGAGGEAVGRLLSERLGFRYVDEEIVSLAADRVGVSVEDVADTEQRKSLVHRMMELLAYTAADADVMGALSVPDDHRELIRDVIDEVAEEGDVVIVAHAAAHALAGREDILRVLVTAPPDVRARRVGADQRLDDDEAGKTIRQEDAARVDYLKRFYGVPKELPEQYDLVVNTELLPPEQITDVVMAAVARE
jgi:cytidylate kinase